MIQGEIGDTVATLQGVPRAQAIEVLKDAAAALKKIKLDSDASTTARRHAKPSTTVSVRPHSPVQLVQPAVIKKRKPSTSRQF